MSWFTEACFVLGLLSTTSAGLAARDDHCIAWAAWLVAGGAAFGVMRWRDANPPEPDALTFWERVLLRRPMIDAVMAWRFWEGLRNHLDPDFRERVMWVSGVMMARGARAKGIGFPCQVTLTERNLSDPKASQPRPDGPRECGSTSRRTTPESPFKGEV
jgi:hypothetical protein